MTGMSYASWLAAAAAVLALLAVDAIADEFASHPPMRPLPVANERADDDSPGYYVDPVRGDDTHDGSSKRPWRTINHGLRQLKPSGILYLRGGTYYEHVDVPCSGRPDQPITIRSAPGELVVIDGGLREFYDEPQKQWLPLKNGATGEYVSVGRYPQFGRRVIVSGFLSAGWEPFHGKEEERPVVLGHFGDSMVPLHGYRTLRDLRDDSMLWDVSNKFASDEGVYCGPGLWYNRRTARIHIRLAHTHLAGLGGAAYRGETDPRKLRLRISGPYGADVLRLNGVRHLVLQDLVLSGGSGSPLIHLAGSEDITLDGLTLFGGSPGLLVKATSQLRIVNCAFRGLAAPWSSRSSMKYRGTPSYRIISQRNKPESHDCEIAYCEFTDDHDGVWLRYIKNLRFHHNLVDYFNDDGIEVGARKRDQELYIYQNRVSRCLLTLTLHEMDKDESPPEVEPGSGVYITRNVFDLRGGVFRGYPREPDPEGKYRKYTGTLCGDHGGPVWPNYFFYHNTVLRADTAWRGYYGFGIGGRATRRTQRRVFNNIFLQVTGLPGLNFASGPDDNFVDGNLHWGVVEGPKFQGDYFKTRKRTYAFRRKPLPEGWMVHDLFADPRLKTLDRDPRSASDVSLRKGSPAIDAGVTLPAGGKDKNQPWFDPLRQSDKGPPDIGAIPRGLKPWAVGINGRFSLSGKRIDGE